jgi:hypothetical protein
MTVLQRLARATGRITRMPLGYALLRLQAELSRRLHRHPAGWWEQRTNEVALLKSLGQADMAALMQHMDAQKLPFDVGQLDRSTLNAFVPCDSAAIIDKAEAALEGWACLLGSGPIQLGAIDWFKDYKSGHAWPFVHYASIDASDLKRNSDVKFPWDLSRLHWLIPVGQAFLLTGNERYADFARKMVDHWITANPCSWGVNWSCTMEPAMRVFVWVWLHRVFRSSTAWADADFNLRFLRSLYLHLHFIRWNLEITDINGNHLTADAAALVTGGAYFATGRPKRWMATGWRILCREMDKQVLDDGVDFEASTAYHRLVTELFFHAAASVEESGGHVPPSYRQKLLQMADYIRAYTRPDGESPVVGDADDARVLPLGSQPLNDHRYLPQLIWARWAPQRLAADWRDSASECLWWWGRPPAEAISIAPQPEPSRLFPHGGNAILRSGDDYAFIDCGPVGLAGRGGHGHNDCLSFEACLLGQRLVADPGCPVYTGDRQLRNLFRSTAVHNTPRLDEEEINRFPSSGDLWSLHDDARGQIELWRDELSQTLFRGAHQGYRRLDPAATVRRALILDKSRHALGWDDSISGVAGALMHLSLQLAPAVTVVHTGSGWLRLMSGRTTFVLAWQLPTDWDVTVGPGAVAPSYGVICNAVRLAWSARSATERQLRCYLYPGDTPDDTCERALDSALARALATC